MDYPNNFDTNVFPTARNIAFSRISAVWYLILVLVIITLSGLIVWTRASVRLAPYMISINQTTGEWSVIGERRGPHDVLSVNIAMQESVAFNFARQWFQITGDENTDAVNWCQCDRVRCAYTQATGADQCFLCCASEARLHRKFIEEIVPGFRARAESGERWTLRHESVVISSIGPVTDSGGLWRINAVLISNMTRPRDIEIYVRIARNETLYPATLGYHVVDFNAFNLGQ
jgi:hypothetical protein